MAQMQNLLRRKAAAASWDGVAAPTPNSRTAPHINTDAQDARRVAFPSSMADSATVAVPGVRTKIRGLRLGERKLLQAIGDALVLNAGGFVILARSENNYDLAALLISLMVVSVLWFFFADAFDAYNVLVLQTRFRNVYYAGKVLVATGVSYTLLAWLLGGTLPIARPRISEMLLATLIIVPL